MKLKKIYYSNLRIARGVFTRENWKLWFVAARFFQIHGTLLLFWPCLWGYFCQTNKSIKFWELAWLFWGSTWMRSVGCVYNDWVDAPLDYFVPRTQNRPLICKAEGWKIPMICICGFFSILAVWTLPFRVVFLGCVGWILSLAYPWLKRYIIPQAALGVLFGWGVWVGAALSMIPSLSLCWGEYIVAVLWSIEYDSVYSAPDQWADRKLGLKSLANYARHQTRRVVLEVCMIRWGIMGILSYSSEKSLILVLLSANITYYSLLKVCFIKSYSCHQYFLLQAWIQGGILVLWAYSLVPF
ncbi:4-hydroxybenzoate octaprenyltransferase [Holospora elegans E1]|uniref:4-hydroxybenzoate octaprenyltransferase n=1 Tax=Holospora elegans E1 TaxID=1427503 RepID=A0A023DWT6_9PROT|nr:UbiA family prenyltransferase [Holospora elegans]GAJ45869.1 4-hydroxybenzoate octaprenyltransferase [Holospora elegans E1]